MSTSSSNNNNNNNYPFNLNDHSNPKIREMAARHNMMWGSSQAVGSALYGQSSNNTGLSKSPSDSKTANSNGIYMVHCYYGCQPGNKVTTVVG